MKKRNFNHESYPVTLENGEIVYLLGPKPKNLPEIKKSGVPKKTVEKKTIKNNGD